MKRILKFLALGLLVLAGAMTAYHYLSTPWGFSGDLPEHEQQLRLALAETAQSHLGCKEEDGSHQKIIDFYNTQDPLPRGYTVQYTDSWCATFVTACAMERGLTDIIPPECSCERMIGLFQNIGCWEESDHYFPEVGDVIFYDWDSKPFQNTTGWSDHVGIVAGTKWPFILVIEGNKDNQVAKRIVFPGHPWIRGYGLPDYAGFAKRTP